MACPITQGLCEQIIRSPCFYVNVQVLPTASSIEIVEDIDTDTLEIGLPKRAYLQIFTEGHSYFKGTYPMAQDIENSHETDLQNTYLACLALLTTTNDHSTIWRVHEQAVQEMCRRTGSFRNENDFRFCTALATSRLDKINKSPLLWHALRKQCASLVLGSPNPGKFYAFLKQILRSMDAHLANYAAGFTLVWLVRLARVRGVGFCDFHVVSLLRENCRRKLGDVLLWTSFGLVLADAPLSCVVFHRCVLSSQSIPAQVSSCKALGCKHNSQGATDQDGIVSLTYADLSKATSCHTQSHQDTPSTERQFSAHNEALSELQWLLDIECLVRVPFDHVLRATQYLENSKALIRQKHQIACSTPIILKSNPKFHDLLTRLAGG